MSQFHHLHRKESRASFQCSFGFRWNLREFFFCDDDSTRIFDAPTPHFLLLTPLDRNHYFDFAIGLTLAWCEFFFAVWTT